MDNTGRANKDFIKVHPCFTEEAHTRFSRAHLSVAPACNIQCRYCIRKFDCANESRPGITSHVLTPDEAVERTQAACRAERAPERGRDRRPGRPARQRPNLCHLRQIHWEYPDLTLCVSTNGLLLSDRLEQLLSSGVRSLTVTINAVTPETG